MRVALRHARLQAEHQAVAAAIPPDPNAEIAKVEQQLAALRRERTNLLTGQGHYAATPTGQAARRYLEAREKYLDAEQRAETADSWRDRRHWRRETARWADEQFTAEIDYASAVQPEIDQLNGTTAHLEARWSELEADRHERASWLADHPEAVRRLESLDHELHPEFFEVRAPGPHHAPRIRRDAGIRPPSQSHGVEIDFGP
jgi:hypothetical protein